MPDFIERDLYDSALELGHNPATAPTAELARKIVAMASSGGFPSLSYVHGVLADTSGSADGIRALREVPSIRSTLEASASLPRDVQYYILPTNGQSIHKVDV